jgi:hypothetical protein
MQHRTQLLTRGLTPLAFAAALILTPLTAPNVASADPLSPQTGARISTTGTPAAGTGGTVYYIDATSGDDANAGTNQTAAWKTLAKVNSSSYVPGDVIAFQRGETFTGSAKILNAGVSTNPITITAYGDGAQPILTNPGGLYMLQLDASYIAVANLAFTDGAVFDNSDGLGISGPKYENSGAVDVTSNGTGTSVEDSTFTNVGIGVKTYGFGSVVTHNTFQNLQIAYRGLDSGSETSYGAIGVSADNSNIEIAYNDFINCRSTNSPYGADGGAVEIEGFTHTKDNITIHHNYSRGSQGFLESTETSTSNVSVTYNVSDDYQQFIAWDTTTTPSGYLAANNTIVRSSDASRLFDQYYYRVSGPAPASNWVTIKNNIFQTTAAFSLFDFPHNHNLFSPSASIGYALGSGDIVADAQFVNPGTRDLRLKLTSPAVDNGTTSTSSTDLDAHAVGVGLGTDIGAFEYQTPATTGASVLTDGGFENQTSITSSSTPWWSEGSLTYGVDVNIGNAHSGQNNGRMATSGKKWGALHQTVTVNANTNYRLVAWVMTSSNIDSGWIGAKTGSGTVLGELRHGQAGTYTQYIVTFNSGANTSIVVHAGMYGAGTGSWERVDDVSLQQL